MTRNFIIIMYLGYIICFISFKYFIFNAIHYLIWEYKMSSFSFRCLSFCFHSSLKWISQAFISCTSICYSLQMHAMFMLFTLSDDWFVYGPIAGLYRPWYYSQCGHSHVVHGLFYWRSIFWLEYSYAKGKY